MKTRVLSFLFHLKNRLFAKPRPKVDRPPDPRIDDDPWLAPVFERLGARYRLGSETPHGLQILRRTGRERFNPMRTYVRPATYELAGEYDVRIRDGQPVDAGRALLDRKISPPLSGFGLCVAHEQVEQWGGEVITRRYAGTVPDPAQAADAIRFLCEQSDQVMDMALEQ